MKDKNYQKTLFYIFLIFWLIMAIAPKYRMVWFVESIFPVILVVLLISTYKKFKFSNVSYTSFFIILMLQTIGSHYSYTEVPLFNYIQVMFDLSRNHYDRFVHFLFGLIMFIPIHEFISIKLKVKKSWGLLLAFLVVIALQGGFEVVEFMHVLITKSDLISAYYLGMQGDIWDAQKDVLMGIIGAAITCFWFKYNLRTKK